jgi:hypothetical protein
MRRRGLLFYLTMALTNVSSADADGTFDRPAQAALEEDPDRPLAAALLRIRARPTLSQK